MSDGDVKKDSDYEAAFEKELAKESKKSAKKAVEAAPAVPPLPPVVAGPEKYRVLEAKLISWHGNLTQLSKGKIVSETHYGKAGIAYFKAHGVKMEPVK